MNEISVVSSLVSERHMTQAGLAYVCTAVQKHGLLPMLVDLSGSIPYFDAPEELYCSCTAAEWMNPDSIAEAPWMDCYFPDVRELRRIVLFSALFSPDIVFHSRMSVLLRKADSNAVTAIGGSALLGLGPEQLALIATFFDYVLVGHDVEHLLSIALATPRPQRVSRGRLITGYSAPQFAPDYRLLPLTDFVTVYSGHGCYYGKCNFCDYPARAHGAVVAREPEDVVRDMSRVCALRPSVSDIVLTQDAYARFQLEKTVSEIAKHHGSLPYNLMVRAESWIDRAIGKMLAGSGCTDVFIGAEALDDTILERLNKGVTVDSIVAAVKTLSEYVNVTIGLVLFVPNITPDSLGRQLQVLEELAPYLYSIEPEVLSIMRGSYFAHNPAKYGIILNATDNLLNDSWCFGLSQDIPWTMRDAYLIEEWLAHADDIKRASNGLVRDAYWEAIDALRDG